MQIKKNNSIKFFSIFLVSCMILSTNFFSIFSASFFANDLVSVHSLKVNGVENPSAIDPKPPLFSWEIEGNARGIRQTAYQIIVEDYLLGELVWDSGKIVSNQSTNVKYTGDDLKSDTRYSWKVHIWNEAGQESGYSQMTSFNIGLAKSDWSAKYIWESSQNVNDYTYFRKGFEINKPIKQAIVYTTAHNDYQLYLNGSLVGVGPARSDPYTYGQYNAFDITDQLINGKNAFAALAHWHGAWSNSGVNASPAYILEARITYQDGSKETIMTDASWKISKQTPYVEENPVYFGHYGGERNRTSILYDANLEIDGWNAADFNDSSWINATVVDRSNYNMYAQLVSEEKEMEWVSPVSIVKEDDRWIVDFGKCLTGWPQIKLHSNVLGDNVKVQYWEVEKGWGDAGYDTYICGGGEEVFYAPFVRHTSFRLLEISGYKGELTVDDVKGIVAFSYADNSGNFSSSDERLNNIYEMSERSGRQNIQQGIISVDANREQSPWTADSWHIGIGALYNHDGTMLIDKVIKDYAGEQLDNGNFLTCSPARDYQSQMAEWSLYWPMMLWQQYLFSGDNQLLQDYYPNLEKFLKYVEESKNPVSGLYNPPGWRASDYAGGSLINGGENIATNSQIYMVLNIAADIAEILDNPNAEIYRKSSKNLYDSININLLIDGQKYKTSTDHSQIHPLGTAWALRAGVVPPVFKQRVVKWFAEQNQSYDVGGYGGDALYAGLFEADLGHIAVSDFARFDNMLNTNNTNWESFGDLSIDNMGNHAWTAYPSYLLQKHFGGIQPISGGFSTFDVKPVIGGLSFVNASVPTIKGEVSVSWEKIDKENLKLNIIVPNNTTANIYMPDNDMSNVVVTESGNIVFNNDTFTATDGVYSGIAKDTSIIFTIGSGTYSFQIKGTPKNTPPVGEIGITPIDDNGIILDDDKASYTGNWVYETGSNLEDRYGEAFRYANWTSGVTTATATYSVLSDRDGEFDIYAWWGVHPNRATNTPFTISTSQTNETYRVNQEIDGGQWNLIGSCDVKTGDKISLVIGNNANEYVIADAVRIVPRNTRTVIVDDDDAVFDGTWIYETASNHDDRYGEGFRYAKSTSGEPTATATYTMTADRTDKYAVYGWWSINENRATDTPFIISADQYSKTYRINQEINGGQWNLIGICDVQQGNNLSVVIANNANEYVIADAIRFSPYIGSDDDLTPLQLLQLQVFKMNTVHTSNCAKASYIKAFELALENANALCNALNPFDEDVLSASHSLELAYQNLIDNPKNNLALNKNVTASESLDAAGVWGAEYLTDGYIALNNSGRVGYTTADFKSQDLENAIEITIDLEEEKTFNSIVLTPRLTAVSWNQGSANFPLDFQLQVSSDNNTYTTVYTAINQANPGFNPLELGFETAKARYVRLHVTKLGEYATGESIPDNPTPYRLQLSEIEVYNSLTEVISVEVLSKSKIVADKRANIILQIDGDFIKDKEILISLTNGTTTYNFETMIAYDDSFNATFNINEKLAPGDYDIWAGVSGEEQNIVGRLAIVALNEDIWTMTPSKNKDGKLMLRFENASLTSKTGDNFNGLVSVNGYVSNSTMIVKEFDHSYIIVNDVDFDSLADNSSIVVNGVKFTELFPSYNFKFSTIKK